MVAMTVPKNKHADVSARGKGKQHTPPPSPKKPREGYNINVWVSDRLGRGFEAMLKRSRRSKTAEVEVLLEEALERLGLLPPEE